jgi:predicted ATPase
LVLEKINKRDKLFIKLAKRKREKTQINKIRVKKENIIRNANGINTAIWEYFKILYYKMVEIMEEMDKLLDAYNLPKLNQGVTKHLKRLIVINESKPS